MGFLERRKTLRVLITASLLALTAISAWHELFPHGVHPLAINDIQKFRPPFLFLTVEAEKYFDSADCSQHNIVPRIVPCVDNPSSVRLLPDATRYAISQYLEHVAKTPTWAIAATFVLELISIAFFSGFILAVLTNRIKNVPESLHVVFAPFGFAFIAYFFYWFLTYRAPVVIYTSIKNRTVLSDLRSVDWLGFLGALPGFFLFLGFFVMLFRYELLGVVMAFILGLVIASVGWAIAPYLPEDLGRPILKTRPDLLWIGALSVAGVTASFMDAYVWMIGFFGIYAILAALTLLSFVPAIVWLAFDRIKSITDIVEAIFRSRSEKPRE